MKKLWFVFGLIFLISFCILGWVGTEIFRQAPPIPAKVLLNDGEIERGQNVWQALGGMQVGSIWGHGSYVAPDWTADWLHRESVFILDRWSNEAYQVPFEKLDQEKQAQLRG